MNRRLALLALALIACTPRTEVIAWRLELGGIEPTPGTRYELVVRRGSCAMPGDVIQRVERSALEPQDLALEPGELAVELSLIDRGGCRVYARGCEELTVPGVRQIVLRVNALAEGALSCAAGCECGSDPPVDGGSDPRVDGGDDAGSADAGRDGGVDACTERAFYRDADGDGWGTRADSRSACEPPGGYVDRAGDCDDGSAAARPMADERCNGRDDDCDDARDEDGVCPSSCTLRNFGGHLYAFCGGSQNWFGARTACEDAGMQLVSVDSLDERDWLLSVLTYSAPCQWTGANDRAVEGEWRWTDGPTFWRGGANGNAVDGRYANWGSNQPSTGAADQDCACLGGGHALLATRCSDGLRWVCEGD